MRYAFVVIPAAVLTTGCSPFLYPGSGRPLVSPFARHAVAPAPPPIGRWDNVMRLPRQSTIDVLTVDGVPKVGMLAGADATSVTVHSNGQDLRVAKAEIVRVDLVDLAGSDGKAVAGSAARGALVGAGAAALLGAVVGGPLWPPPGILVRAGVAQGAVVGGRSALAGRQRRMIYLVPGQGQSSSSCQPHPDVTAQEPSAAAASDPHPLPACTEPSTAPGIPSTASPYTVQSPIHRWRPAAGPRQGAGGGRR